MVKCNLTEAEVLAAEQEFNAANPSGVIAKEKFILSMQVTINVWLTVVKRYKIPLFIFDLIAISIAIAGCLSSREPLPCV